MTGYCHACRKRYGFQHTCPEPSPGSPLPHYAGYEEMSGRLRATVSVELFGVLGDRTDHDPGDE